MQKHLHTPRAGIALKSITLIAAGLLFVEGCASNKQYKGEYGNTSSMANGRIELSRQAYGGEDSLKTVQKPISSEEKIKARLKELKIQL